MCMVLQVHQAITEVFWTNVCDEDLPFGGIIEHTNLVPTAWYGGRHVVYVSRYFSHAEGIATADIDQVREDWIAALLATFTHLDASDILHVDIFRTPYAAPLVSVPYLPQIPPDAEPPRGPGAGDHGPGVSAGPRHEPRCAVGRAGDRSWRYRRLDLSRVRRARPAARVPGDRSGVRGRRRPQCVPARVG